MVCSNIDEVCDYGLNEETGNYEGMCVKKEPDCGLWAVCALYCEHGMAVNKDRCPLCKCKPEANPCKSHECDEGERCELQCPTLPCNPQPTCVGECAFAECSFSQLFSILCCIY